MSDEPVGADRTTWSAFRGWWSSEWRTRKRRKCAKFIAFSVLLSMVPAVATTLADSEFYFVAIAMLLAGTGEMLFDREHNGQASLAFLCHIFLCLALCIYGAALYGATKEMESAFLGANGVATPRGGDGLPTIPPLYLLAMAAMLGVSAAYFSEAPATMTGDATRGAN